MFKQYCQTIATGVPLIKDDLIYADVFGTQQLTKVYNLQVSKLNDGFVATWRDVTVQRQAEQERDRFFNLSLDLMAIGNFDGYFTRLNPASEKILGFTTVELMARPFLDFVHPDDREQTLAVETRLSEGQMEIDFENRYRCQDGSYRWLSWNVKPHTELNSWYGVGRDITEQQAALRERQLADALIRESKSKFSAVFNQTFGLVGLLSVDGVVLEANQTALKSIAAVHSEIVGQNFWDTPWWRHSPQLQHQLKNAISQAASGQLGGNAEFGQIVR